MPFQGVPSFFRGLCRSARVRENGADHRGVGRSFLTHVVALNNCDDLTDETRRAGQIEALLRTENVAGAWDWFAREYPSCAELIPERRRAAFVAGMLERFDSDGL